MRDTTVAGRYARALFLVSEKRHETVEALAQLKGVAALLAPGRRESGFFASPEVSLADKRAALERALRGRVLPLIERFIDLLLRKKRLGELATVTSEYEQLVERAQRIRHAHVVSAVPLITAELERLHGELQGLLGGEVRLSTEVDPALIGGALVRVGDRVIDRSVRTLLDAIAEKLAHVSV